MYCRKFCRSVEVQGILVYLLTVFGKAASRASFVASSSCSKLTTPLRRRIASWKYKITSSVINRRGCGVPVECLRNKDCWFRSRLDQTWSFSPGPPARGPWGCQKLVWWSNGLFHKHRGCQTPNPWYILLINRHQSVKQSVIWDIKKCQVLPEFTHCHSHIRRFPISWYTKPNCGFLRPTIVELG